MLTTEHVMEYIISPGPSSCLDLTPASHLLLQILGPERNIPTPQNSMESPCDTYCPAAYGLYFTSSRRVNQGSRPRRFLG